MTHPAADHPAAIHIDGLTKRFDATTAVEGVSLDVEPGELFGVIGPDGAGKTTLLRMLVTVLLPDAGRAEVAGLDVVADYLAVRRIVGYMPGRFSLYPDLTVRENLEFFASVFGTTVEAQYALIAPIYSQIEPFDARRAQALSGGMKQKLALCCALVHRPRVLLLDEPTTGVDAVSRAEFWDMLDALKRSGITTMVSTPYMDEAARCDRVALLQNGALLRPADTPSAIVADFATPMVRVRAKGSRPRLLRDLRSFESVGRAEVFGEWIHASAHTASNVSVTDLAAAVGAGLAARGWAEVAVAPATASIEDVFMALMAAPSLASSETEG